MADSIDDPYGDSPFKRGVAAGKVDAKLKGLEDHARELNGTVSHMDDEITQIKTQIAVMAEKVALGAKLIGILSGLIITANVLHLFGIAI